MSKTDQISRRIAYYIYDDMEPAERIEFEEDLENDAELAMEYKRQLSAVNYLKAKTLLEEFRSQPDLEEADRIVDEFFAKQNSGIEETDETEGQKVNHSSVGASKSTNFRRVLYPILVAATVFAGLLIIRNVMPGNPSARVFNQYYQPLDDVSFTGRGENIELYERFREAINLYLDGDYSHSSPILANLLDEDPDFAESALYLGLSKMGEQKYSESALVFESFLNQFNKYQPEAKWYLAMCYLKLDRSVEAKALFSDLTEVEGVFGQDAQEILKKLRKVE